MALDVPIGVLGARRVAIADLGESGLVTGRRDRTYCVRQCEFMPVAVARRLGMPLDRLGNPTAEIGLLNVVDENARRFTHVTGDAEAQRRVVAAIEAGQVPPPHSAADTYPIIIPGWPDEWLGTEDVGRTVRRLQRESGSVDPGEVVLYGGPLGVTLLVRALERGAGERMLVEAVSPEEARLCPGRVVGR